MAPLTVLYAGCYTHESATGIRVYDASDPDGSLDPLSQVEGIEHPSFLAVHPNGRHLYAVSETAAIGGEGLVAFRIDQADGSLSQIDRASSHGAAPCYVSLDTRGEYLYVANYVSGTIAVYEIADDGRFDQLVAIHQHIGSGPSPRQDGPHAHCIVPSPVGQSVYAADLGTDCISRFTHGRNERFRFEDDFALKSGSGPRHLAFHPHEPVAFLVCELDSTIVMLELDPTSGRMTERRVHSTLPDDFVGYALGAEVRVHPVGHRVYVSNRGHDSIAVFGFNGTSEPLEQLGHVHSGGETPRNFAVHPAGRSLLVANQDSGTIIPFSLDPSTGIPQQLDLSYVASQPVCLTFAEVNR